MSDPTQSLLDLPCLSPWIAAQVVATVRISACCNCPVRYVVPHPGGDLIADMNSPAARELRQKMSSGWLCPTCHHFGIYRFNPAMAWGKIRLRPDAWAHLRRGKGPSLRFLRGLDVRAREIADGAMTISLPPLWATLSIDMKCNLHCIMCPQRRLPAEKQAPTPNSYLDFVLENHDLIGHVSLAGGEPFASETTLRFMDRVAAKPCDFGVNITTNGTLVRFGLVQRLPMLAATFSCDAATPETYAAIRRGGDFDTFINNISRYRELIRAGEISGGLRVNFTVMQQNLQEIPAAVKIFNDLDIPILFTKCQAAVGHDIDDMLIDDLAPEQRQEAIAHISAALEIAKGQAKDSLSRIRGSLESAPEPKPAAAAARPTRYRGFVGPCAYYDLKGAQQFNLLTLLGLREHHSLLDIGCGSLRAGRLFIPYLNAGNYFGIEPNEWLVTGGIEREVGRDLMYAKNVNISYDSTFDFSVFKRGSFDFLLAHSIFTHMSLADIRKCLAEARNVMHEHSIFLFDFTRDSVDADAPKSLYTGKENSNTSFRLETIAEAVAKTGLLCQVFAIQDFGRTWAATYRTPPPEAWLTRAFAAIDLCNPEAVKQNCPILLPERSDDEG